MTSQMGVNTTHTGLCVACSPPLHPPTAAVASLPGLSRAAVVFLPSPRWWLIPRSKDTTWPSLGMLHLLVVPLGLITVYGSNALFFSSASHLISSLNHLIHPSHLPLGPDCTVFNHLHYCSIRALLFEGKNFYLE